MPQWPLRRGGLSLLMDGYIAAAVATQQQGATREYERRKVGGVVRGWESLSWVLVAQTNEAATINTEKQMKEARNAEMPDAAPKEEEMVRCPLHGESGGGGGGRGTCRG